MGAQDEELWEEFSRLTDEQIWDDNDTERPHRRYRPAVEIVNQVKARGPFMSISDFVNRRIGIDSRSYQGAIQEAIEQAGHQWSDQSTGIRAGTSDVIPNYKAFSDSWKIKLNGAQWYVSDDFPIRGGSIPMVTETVPRDPAGDQPGKYPAATRPKTKRPLRHLPHPCLWGGQRL